jgi:hypothetical protein
MVCGVAGGVGEGRHVWHSHSAIAKVARGLNQALQATYSLFLS